MRVWISARGPFSVIASAAKQSRIPPRRQSGLLRRFAPRNDPLVVPRARVSKDEGRDETARPSWFETALARLLTMRVMDFGARPFLRHCERSEAIQKCIRGDSLDCFVASLLAMTMHQIAATQTDDPGHQTHLRILAACFARALFQLLTPFPERGRREDRVPAGTHGLCAERMRNDAQRKHR